jgi:hypothetical protein
MKKPRQMTNTRMEPAMTPALPSAGRPGGRCRRVCAKALGRLHEVLGDFFITEYSGRTIKGSMTCRVPITVPVVLCISVRGWSMMPRSISV